MRLDLDQQYWQSAIATDDIEKNEQELFASLDYVSHDQRAYGYPYPIKAAHDRASLTEHERTVLRQQLVESAVQAGISRNAFRDPSQMTGHR
jgi:NurA-like 5'-3' nuclease